MAAVGGCARQRGPAHPSWTDPRGSDEPPGPDAVPTGPGPHRHRPPRRRDRGGADERLRSSPVRRPIERPVRAAGHPARLGLGRQRCRAPRRPRAHRLRRLARHRERGGACPSVGSGTRSAFRQPVAQRPGQPDGDPAPRRPCPGHRRVRRPVPVRVHRAAVGRAVRPGDRCVVVSGVAVRRSRRAHGHAAGGRPRAGDRRDGIRRDVRLRRVLGSGDDDVVPGRNPRDRALRSCQRPPARRAGPGRRRPRCERRRRRRHRAVGSGDRRVHAARALPRRSARRHRDAAARWACPARRRVDRPWWLHRRLGHAVAGSGRLQLDVAAAGRPRRDALGERRRPGHGRRSRGDRRGDGVDRALGGCDGPIPRRAPDGPPRCPACRGPVV